MPHIHELYDFGVLVVRIAHDGVKPILIPSYVDVHRISETHRHIFYCRKALEAARRRRP